MKAFEISIDGELHCVAGIGANGVLNAIVGWVGGQNRDEDFLLQIGGLDTATDEHVHWNAPTVGVGAEITVRIVETESIDPPAQRYRSERPTTLEQYRSCLQQFDEWMTSDERRQLRQELIEELKT